MTKKTKKKVPSKPAVKMRAAKPRAVATKRRAKTNPQPVLAPAPAPKSELKLDMARQVAELDKILHECPPGKEIIREEVRAHDSGDMALALVNVETQAIILDGDRMKKVLARAAKSKIEDGTYEVCSACEDTIPVKRLIGTPYALLCIPCQEKRDDGMLECDLLERLIA